MILNLTFLLVVFRVSDGAVSMTVKGLIIPSHQSEIICCTDFLAIA